ncbi:DUF7662 domain-containing protein [Paenibacillus ginsengarvi]|uniref:DUF7662 domain-containing protein n=1 Tax=Paenibacillus ginsengarvi TaxID=400777 RepID=A0A3B0CMX0_9BACL|nr:hypothetical protein [Paenibacillus ginsengarvi]RKN85737.1 hypothetical protein D7M11_05175 [Paenibacillus ginsengarvi]
MMNKYKRLEEYLNVQTNPRVTLAFEQIEDILGFQLPPKARTEPQWWNNTISDSESQAIAWLKVFRRVSHVKPGERVTFVRAIL